MVNQQKFEEMMNKTVGLDTTNNGSNSGQNPAQPSSGIDNNSENSGGQNIAQTGSGVENPPVVSTTGDTAKGSPDVLIINDFGLPYNDGGLLPDVNPDKKNGEPEVFTVKGPLSFSFL